MRRCGGNEVSERPAGADEAVSACSRSFSIIDGWRTRPIMPRLVSYLVPEQGSRLLTGTSRSMEGIGEASNAVSVGCETVDAASE